MKCIEFDDIKKATRGAVRFEEKDGRLLFHRFTEEEYAGYTPHNPEALSVKMPATSCIHIVFSTDSDTLFIKGRFKKSATRLFGDAVDVFVDGVRYGSVGHKGKEMSELAEQISLPSGEKRVTLVLPGLFSFALRELSLALGASFIPLPAKRKLLIYGDSITQGYDAVYPSHSYANQLALLLDADAVNKAIGGEVYFPTLATLSDGTDPDIITVAYGVNDWRHDTRRTALTLLARDFYTALAEKHPRARIFALSPIWTADWEKGTPFPFRDIPTLLAEAARDIPSVTVIDCFDFVPSDSTLFMDKTLHPNDEGYDYYFKSLQKALSAYGIE